MWAARTAAAPFSKSKTSRWTSGSVEPVGDEQGKWNGNDPPRFAALTTPPRYAKGAFSLRAHDLRLTAHGSVGDGLARPAFPRMQAFAF